MSIIKGNSSFRNSLKDIEVAKLKKTKIAGIPIKDSKENLQDYIYETNTEKVFMPVGSGELVNGQTYGFAKEYDMSLFGTPEEPIDLYIDDEGENVNVISITSSPVGAAISMMINNIQYFYRKISSTADYKWYMFDEEAGEPVEFNDTDSIIFTYNSEFLIEGKENDLKLILSTKQNIEVNKTIKEKVEDVKNWNFDSEIKEKLNLNQTYPLLKTIDSLQGTELISYLARQTSRATSYSYYMWGIGDYIIDSTWQSNNIWNVYDPETGYWNDLTVEFANEPNIPTSSFYIQGRNVFHYNNRTFVTKDLNGSGIDCNNCIYEATYNNTTKTLTLTRRDIVLGEETPIFAQCVFEFDNKLLCRTPSGIYIYELDLDNYASTPTSYTPYYYYYDSSNGTKTLYRSTNGNVYSSSGYRWLMKTPNQNIATAAYDGWVTRMRHYVAEDQDYVYGGYTLDQNSLIFERVLEDDINGGTSSASPAISNRFYIHNGNNIELCTYTATNGARTFYKFNENLNKFEEVYVNLDSTFISNFWGDRIFYVNGFAYTFVNKSNSDDTDKLYKQTGFANNTIIFTQVTINQAPFRRTAYLDNNATENQVNKIECVYSENDEDYVLTLDDTYYYYRYGTSWVDSNGDPVDLSNKTITCDWEKNTIYSDNIFWVLANLKYTVYETLGEKIDNFKNWTYEYGDYKLKEIPDWKDCEGYQNTEWIYEYEDNENNVWINISLRGDDIYGHYIEVSYSTPSEHWVCEISNKDFNAYKANVWYKTTDYEDWVALDSAPELKLNLNSIYITNIDLFKALYSNVITLDEKINSIAAKEGGLLKNKVYDKIEKESDIPVEGKIYRFKQYPNIDSIISVDTLEGPQEILIYTNTITAESDAPVEAGIIHIFNPIYITYACEAGPSGKGAVYNYYLNIYSNSFDPEGDNSENLVGTYRIAYEEFYGSDHNINYINQWDTENSSTIARMSIEYINEYINPDFKDYFAKFLDVHEKFLQPQTLEEKFNEPIKNRIYDKVEKEVTGLKSDIQWGFLDIDSSQYDFYSDDNCTISYIIDWDDNLEKYVKRFFITPPFGRSNSSSSSIKPLIIFSDEVDYGDGLVYKANTWYDSSNYYEAIEGDTSNIVLNKNYIDTENSYAEDLFDAIYGTYTKVDSQTLGEKFDSFKEWTYDTVQDELEEGETYNLTNNYDDFFEKYSLSESTILYGSMSSNSGGGTFIDNGGGNLALSAQASPKSIDLTTPASTNDSDSGSLRDGGAVMELPNDGPIKKPVIVGIAYSNINSGPIVKDDLTFGKGLNIVKDGGDSGAKLPEPPAYIEIVNSYDVHYYFDSGATSWIMIDSYTHTINKIPTEYLPELTLDSSLIRNKEMLKDFLKVASKIITVKDAIEAPVKDKKYETETIELKDGLELKPKLNLNIGPEEMQKYFANVSDGDQIYDNYYEAGQGIYFTNSGSYYSIFYGPNDTTASNGLGGRYYVIFKDGKFVNKWYDSYSDKEITDPENFAPIQLKISSIELPELFKFMFETTRNITLGEKIDNYKNWLYEKKETNNYVELINGQEYQLPDSYPTGEFNDIPDELFMTVTENDNITVKSIRAYYDDYNNISIDIEKRKYSNESEYMYAVILTDGDTMYGCQLGDDIPEKLSGWLKTGRQIIDVIDNGNVHLAANDSGGASMAPDLPVNLPDKVDAPKFTLNIDYIISDMSYILRKILGKEKIIITLGERLDKIDTNIASFNISIPVELWDDTEENAIAAVYPYQAIIDTEYLIGAIKCEVQFDLSDQISGNYAQYYNFDDDNGELILYAKEIPADIISVKVIRWLGTKLPDIIADSR